MSFDHSEIGQLKAVVNVLQKIIAQKSKTSKKPTRVRRSGKELAAFRKMLRSERRKGVPVAALAERHGISSAYIYQL